jgi:hypothetical protein
MINSLREVTQRLSDCGVFNSEELMRVPAVIVFVGFDELNETLTSRHVAHTTSFRLSVVPFSKSVPTIITSYPGLDSFTLWNILDLEACPKT